LTLKTAKASLWSASLHSGSFQLLLSLGYLVGIAYNVSLALLVEGDEALVVHRVDDLDGSLALLLAFLHVGELSLQLLDGLLLLIHLALTLHLLHLLQLVQSVLILHLGLRPPALRADLEQVGCDALGCCRCTLVKTTNGEVCSAEPGDLLEMLIDCWYALAMS